MNDKNNKLFKILLVEDKLEIKECLLSHLEKQGYLCIIAISGKETLAIIEEQKPNLVLLDIEVPDATDFALTKKIRQQYDCGLIMVASEHHQECCLASLRAGVDHYLVKPLDVQELLLLVNNLLLRLDNDIQFFGKDVYSIQFNNWLYLPKAFKLQHDDGRAMSITKAEHEILMVFLEKPNQIISREDFMALLMDDSIYDRAIDSRISRLKKKITLENSTHKLIETIYGSGYIFNANVEVLNA